jgi:hypothetical protein
MPGIYPGFSPHEEMALLVQCGFTPREALQAATNSSITAGARADLFSSTPTLFRTSATPHAFAPCCSMAPWFIARLRADPGCWAREIISQVPMYPRQQAVDMMYRGRLPSSIALRTLDHDNLAGILRQGRTESHPELLAFEYELFLHLCCHVDL